MIKAVIFDNDGVIVDSEPLHHLVEAQTIAGFGHKVAEDFFDRYVGIGMERMLDDWIERFQLPVSADELAKIHLQNLVTAFKQKVTLTPQIKKLISYLADHHYPMAVASSSTRELINVGLLKYQLKPYFAHIVSTDDVTRTKPNPEIFLTAAKRLGQAPENCLVIEDSAAGVTAAKAAGMYCVGYENPLSGDQNLTQADIRIREFSALINLFQEGTL